MKKKLEAALGEPAESTDKPTTVIALSRGLQILQCFSAAKPELGSAELARMTNMPQPTVWRLCQTLVHHAFLLPTPNAQRFQLGTSALAIGVAASATFSAIGHVRGRMQFLADRFKSAVSIATRENLDMVYLERCAAQVMVGTNMQKGSRLPMHKCTLGWAYLSALNDQARSALIGKLIAEYPEDRERIEALSISKPAELAETGYVLERGLIHRHIAALAIPIMSSAGPQFAVNCSCDTESVTQAQLRQEIAPALHEIAGILSAFFLGPTENRLNGDQSQWG